MSIYRSEEMVRSQLYLQLDAAYATVSELGELGLVQFKDFNANVNAFQRKFVNEVRRCDEMERKLRYVEKEIVKDGITIVDTGENPKAPYPREIVDLEATFERLESELREVNTNAEALKKNFMELTELQEVLTRAQDFFSQKRESLHNIMDDTVPLERSGDRGPASLQLGFVSGVIRRDKIAAFERILWFACRGNVFMRTDDNPITIKDTHTGDDIQKMVFIIFFQGEQLKSRVRKICDGYRATLYPVSEEEREREVMLAGVTERIAELVLVLDQTESHRERVLRTAAKDLHIWILKVRKIKAIYHTMNECNFDMSRGSLIAEIWSPLKAMDDINTCLLTGAEISGSSMPPILHRIHSDDESPPTYYASNKLSRGFQGIINAYGIANYREINPALYTCVTFPFLFAVMFGDAGHGLLMFLFALSLCVFEKKIGAMKNIGEVSEMFFNGRYIILLMGAFSIYTGLIYNDIYSKSANIFGTHFHSKFTSEELDKGDFIHMNPTTTYDGYPYPFGMDPIWQISDASTKITYLNSLKMKCAIILGVTQMVFGLFLSLVNKVYFKNFLGIFCEFIPELLFLLSIFGYLAILLFYKWVNFNVHNSAAAPALLIQLINMFMFQYQTGPLIPIEQQVFYPNQQTIQTLLVLIAGISAPWLLLAKPLYLLYQNKKLTRESEVHGLENGNGVARDSSASEPLLGPSTGLDNASYQNPDVSLHPIMPEMESQATEEAKTEEAAADVEKGEPKDDYDENAFNFGEVIMLQVIHTIDFCLSCVSHTASYLRLWALSLAHAELSEVFWDMVFKRGLKINGYLGFIMVFATWIVWAFITIGVLLVMEGLSAFLHALRLHWVEFQTKFYGGEGYQFEPFTFKHIHDMVLEEPTK